ncbi:MAG: Lrp/AsnC family transcriptional regulator [Firmicutes bacterium]|nr:Lrp/AsnC family transcriptional regulator [Erysipelotrichaceae bacterium]MDD6524887.1 Lrp/AsnC family transcriptional regulator [Bacillota bacterium]MDD7227767.1 Lrp/AsnC family transcriptional regulator [Bacillota bacterium]MDY4972615.1 Lrp/AsnC family transcriptional regulator [Erysipelotrichaceae bacterium]MDY5996983.1 Lrp/AsnC family transcriptional regulator [Erysipelotrichaceae bacterium]
MDDVRLLKVLENDPRISVRDLADILNETENNVLEVKRRLEKEKVICGYHTVINWDKTNHDKVQAIIEVSAKPERDKGYDNVAMRIARYPEVKSLYLMSGKSEFIVMIDGKSMREIADFVGQKLAPIEGVTQTVTCFVLKQYKIEGVVMDEKTFEDKRQIVTP